MSVEDVETARVGPVVLRVGGREEAARLDVRLTVEVVRTPRAPSPASAHKLELTFIITRHYHVRRARLYLSLIPCVSVCPESVLWQNGCLDPDAVLGGELVGGRMSVLDGGGEHQRKRVNFGRPIVWGLCCVVVRERRTLPKTYFGEDLFQFLRRFRFRCTSY